MSDKIKKIRGLTVDQWLDIKEWLNIVERPIVAQEMGLTVKQLTHSLHKATFTGTRLKRTNKLMEVTEEHFYSLVRKPVKKKKRNCLRCGVSFISPAYENRCCGSCVASNSAKSYRAGEVY